MRDTPLLEGAVIAEDKPLSSQDKGYVMAVALPFNPMLRLMMAYGGVPSACVVQEFKFLATGVRPLAEIWIQGMAVAGLDLMLIELQPLGCNASVFCRAILETDAQHFRHQDLPLDRGRRLGLPHRKQLMS